MKFLFTGQAILSDPLTGQKMVEWDLSKLIPAIQGLDRFTSYKTEKITGDSAHTIPGLSGNEGQGHLIVNHGPGVLTIKNAAELNGVNIDPGGYYILIGKTTQSVVTTTSAQQNYFSVLNFATGRGI